MTSGDAVSVKRQTTMSVAAIWLVAVAASWVATTALLAVLIKATASRDFIAELLGQSAASATFACVVIGGRRRQLRCACGAAEARAELP
jgi:hypothetical protein